MGQSVSNGVSGLFSSQKKPFDTIGFHVVGPSQCGKASFAHYVTKNEMLLDPSSLPRTDGNQIFEGDITDDDGEIITKLVAEVNRGTHHQSAMSGLMSNRKPGYGVVFLYDVNDLNSIETTIQWISDARIYILRNMDEEKGYTADFCVVVGTKLDMTPEYQNPLKAEIGSWVEEEWEWDDGMNIVDIIFSYLAAQDMIAEDKKKWLHDHGYTGEATENMESMREYANGEGIPHVVVSSSTGVHIPEAVTTITKQVKKYRALPPRRHRQHAKK